MGEVMHSLYRDRGGGVGAGHPDRVARSRKRLPTLINQPDLEVAIRQLHSGESERPGGYCGVEVEVALRPVSVAGNVIPCGGESRRIPVNAIHLRDDEQPDAAGTSRSRALPAPPARR
jgi:hypothetical protein